MRTNEEFRKLIDKIEYEQLLKAYFQLIKKLNLNEVGKLWEELTAEERDELLLSFDESNQPQNLMSHVDVKKNHERWLKK